VFGLSLYSVHQQRYQPSDRNTDYWADDTPGTNSLPAEVSTQWQKHWLLGGWYPGD